MRMLDDCEIAEVSGGVVTTVLKEIVEGPLVTALKAVPLPLVDGLLQPFLLNLLKVLGIAK